MSSMSSGSQLALVRCGERGASMLRCVRQDIPSPARNGIHGKRQPRRESATNPRWRKHRFDEESTTVSVECAEPVGAGQERKLA
jgi:hypothetical protein